MLRNLFRVAAGLLLAAAVGCAGAHKHKACCPEGAAVPAPVPAAAVPADPLLPGPPAGVAPY